jgi:Tfp pilus assembly protein PilP
MEKCYLALALALTLLSGCGESEQQYMERMNVAIRGDVNSLLKKQNYPATCTEVQLVRETPNIYTGYANLSNGKQHKIRVTRDEGSGRMILEIVD